MRRAVRIGVLVGILGILAFGRLTYDAQPTEPSTYEECEQQHIVCY